MKKINEILAGQIFLIKLGNEEMKKVRRETEQFISELEKRVKKRKINAEVFLGGSLAKGTVIKKKKLDIDVFVRFDKKYEDKEISKLLGGLLRGKRIHGSRDYFKIARKGICFEIVPVVKIAKPEQARNVTDLSFFHVKYIADKIKKNKKLADGIMLAKSFCYAQGCYGAESYIRGFSGYGLELLICHYGGFLKFIKAMSRIKEKEIIDIAGFYKNKKQVLWNINETKLESPIILIDPTFKERNALAALSDKTLEKFREVCRKFLRAPSGKFFEKEDIEEVLKKKYRDLEIIETKSNRQKGDIAGAKLKKFYEFFSRNLGKYFEIKVREFEYDEERNAGRMFFVLKKRERLFIQGPDITKVENLVKFRKKHRSARIKNKRAYAIEKNNMTLKKFISEMRRKQRNILRAMGIVSVSLV